MGRVCQVCYVNDFQPNISFHIIPNNPRLRKKWFTALGFPDDKYMPQRAFVCSRHFSSNDFTIKANGVSYLRSDSVPQLLDPEKSQSKSQEQEEIIRQKIESIPQQNSEEMPGSSINNTSSDYDNILCPSTGVLRSTSTGLEVKPQTKDPSFSSSINNTSSDYDNILCPSTGVLRSTSTGLEVKPPTKDPSPVIPVETDPPAGLKTIIYPKLSSAPVQLNTLWPEFKEKPVEPSLPMDRIRTSPVMKLEKTGVLDMDRITEDELARLIEADSPLLTAEMIFNRKRVYRKRYIGDLTIDDFGTPAGQMFFLAAKKRAGMYRTKIKTSMQTRNRLRTKLGKFNRIIKILESTCDVSEAKKILEGKEKDDCSSASSSSKEEDDSDIEPVIMNPFTKIDPVHFAAYEKQETRINHFELSNRVQVKFLPEGDTEMIDTLKFEINKLSHSDIRKSKRIDELYNAIFKKNKIIDDLYRQIEELKEAVKES